MTNSTFQHKSVLTNECLSHLNVQPGDCVFDCTAGGGGHSMELWKRIAPHGQLVCIDRDPHAIEHLKTVFADLIPSRKVLVIKNTFSNLQQIAKVLNFSGKISAILADLGVSSPQLDQAERGFSFMKDAPLDMRMDQSQGNLSAKDVLATSSERELQNIFQNFGEERYSRRIAKKIVETRSTKEILTTKELADIIVATVPFDKKSKRHPATQVFQALRIFVNSELTELQGFLSQAFEVLKPKGRLAVISFHSLEDRIVKNFFKEKEGKNSQDPVLKHLPILHSEIPCEGTIIKPFPISPSPEEILLNFRARSAKLRVIEKIGTNERNQRKF